MINGSLYLNTFSFTHLKFVFLSQGFYLNLIIIFLFRYPESAEEMLKTQEHNLFPPQEAKEFK